MSFFLGKDSSGDSVLHITQGTNTIPEMLGGVRSNTVFHSSLPYIEIEEYSCTTSIETTSVYDAIIGSYTNVNKLLITPESSFLASYSNEAYFITVNGVSPKYFSNPNNTTSGGVLCNWLWYSGTSSSSTPSTTYSTTKFWLRNFRILYHPSFGIWYQQVVDNTFENITAPYTVKLYKVKNLDRYGNYIFNATSGGIMVSNTSFNVNGKESIDYSYISRTKLNTTDNQITADGSGSFNSTNAIYTVLPPSSGSFKLLSNFGNSKIYRGNYLMFDSNSPPVSLYNTTSSYTVPLLNAPTDIRYTWSFVVASGFTSGMLFTISSIKKGFNSSQLYGDSVFDLYTFRVGTIYSSHYVTNSGYGKNVTWDLIGLSDGTIRLDVSIEPNSTLGGWLEERTLKFIKFNL